MYRTFYDRPRKGMCYVGRMYSKTRDGEFNGSHQSYSKLDRNYVKNRISDEMIKDTGSSDWMHDTKDITEDLYMVIVYVKENSKKFDCLKRLGFELINGIA